MYSVLDSATIDPWYAELYDASASGVGVGVLGVAQHFPPLHGHAGPPSGDLQ